MQKIKIAKNELFSGQPLPWSIYAVDGKLLLDQGQTLSNDNQVENLLARGVLRKPTTEELNREKKATKLSSDSLFEILDSLKIHLQQILIDLTHNVKSDYSLRIIKLTKIIQKLSFENSDAILGAIILDQDSPYTHIHPIYCAILTELLNRRKKIPDEDRLLYIAAALTQNVGMFELQKELSNQIKNNAPTETQKKTISEHPYKSMEILLGHGIEYKDWLNTILYHHERPDGQGYPVGMKGDDIPIHAKILSITDIYSAMILPRKYRDGFFVKKALQDIFIQRGKLVDESIAQLLIKEIGIYPPGTFVKLANGETAIVVRRGTKSANSPRVLSILNPCGDYLERPRHRDTIHKDIYGVLKVVPKLTDFKMNRNEIWEVI